MLKWYTLLVPIVATAGGMAFAADLLPPDKTVEEVVDHYIDADLKSAGTTPAPQASDADLVRRIVLDLAGRVPAIVEARGYVDSQDPNKRAQLVDELIASPEFVEHMSHQFNFMLNGTESSVQGYLKLAFQENRSWDRMFREMLLPTDEEETKGAIDFLKNRVKDTDKLTNDVSVAFFGINISCAKCHDHPEVTDWKQDHFYGMKSFFARSFENGGFVGERDYGLVSFKTTAGEDKQANLMFLSGFQVENASTEEPSAEQRKKYEEELKKLAKEKKAPPEPKVSLRQKLVEVALQPGQDQFFSRAIVNRVWHLMIGYGLVMPLDQMHSANPASHPELLDWLARDLVNHKYDLKRLIRGLALSDVYSRGSQWKAEERPYEHLFAVANLRPLTREQYSRSLSLASADPDGFKAEMKPEDLRNRIAGAANAGFASRFDQPGEDFQVSAYEALFFSNSGDAERFSKGGLTNRLRQIEDQRELIETAVWTILSRSPTDEEVEILAGYLNRREDRREQACQQLVWSLLTSTEFRFNH